MVLAGEAVVDRLAREMIERHGSEAALRATERVNDLFDKGDADGCISWAAVVHAIHELQDAAPFPSLHSPTRPPARQ